MNPLRKLCDLLSSDHQRVSDRMYLIRNRQSQYLSCMRLAASPDVRGKQRHRREQHFLVGFPSEHQCRTMLKRIEESSSITCRVVGTASVKIEYGRKDCRQNQDVEVSDMAIHRFFALPYTENVGIVVPQMEDEVVDTGTSSSYVPCLIVPPQTSADIFREHVLCQSIS